MEKKYYINGGVSVVATQTTLRDVGLDLRKLPDLTDSATRKRLSPAAIEAVLEISEKWGLKSDDAMLLLRGISNGRYYGLKKSRRGPLTQDELTRLAADRNLQSPQHSVQ